MGIDTTFVTSFYPLKRPEGPKLLKPNEFLEYFRQLVNTGIDIVFFHDSYGPTIELIEELKDKSNLTCILRPLTSLNTFNMIDTATGNDTIVLPAERYKIKDTIDFMTIMLSKLELVNIAKKIKSSRYYAWIDSAIFKIIKDKNQITKALNNIPEINETKITIPGCWTKGTGIDSIYDKINWRFCGGFFIGTANTIDKFNDIFINQLKKILSEKRIVWETNIWALCEQSDPSLFAWFKADHDDSMLMVPMKEEVNEIIKTTIQTINIDDIGSSPIVLSTKSNQHSNSKKRVILLTMVKNEEKIIERLIKSTLPAVDAVCVCDTGSTDKTRDIVERLKSELPIPVGLYQDEWKNFGHNRSLSFKNGRNFCDSLDWSRENTYGLLLDGDMILKIGPKYNKEDLKEGGYLVIQRTHSLDYHNTRFVRFSDDWTCVGVTHEYWNGPAKTELSVDFIHIDDIGDGGCKADKFVRDIRLLTEGIEKEPNNERYYFYLAQSYRDSGQPEKAIEFYKKRIAKGGWAEEVWFSYYSISKLYLQLNKPFKAEKWAMKAYKIRPSRAEPLYFLVLHFRNIGDQYRAMSYYKLAKDIPYPKDLLFIEKNIYTYLLKYEYTILHYYVNPNNNFFGSRFCLEYLNQYRHNWDNVFSNLQYYIPRLAHEFTPKKINAICPDSDFRPSSISLIKHRPTPTSQEQLLANIRFVNYKIRPDGGYDMMENGVYNSAYWVRTKNAYQYFDPTTLEPISNLVMMNGLPDDIPKFHQTNIRGLEDVRLFKKNDEIYYNATTREFSYDGKNRIITGKYDLINQAFKNNITIRPPTETDCEKNWIGHNDNVVYKWSPLEVGKINEKTKQLEIHTSHTNMPFFFERIRGSSSLINYEGLLWCVTHSVLYVTPRKYYHNLVVLDPATYKPVKMSIPFAFYDTKIEYCLGFERVDNDFIFTYSMNDSEPHFVRVPIAWFKKHMMLDL